MQRKRPRFRAISVLVALCLSIQLCFAQNTANASLEILVRDPSGALINKAQVQLLYSSKPQSAQTNQKGEARFNKLTPGRYQIHVEAPGFKAYDVDAFSISTGINRTEITLEIDVIKQMSRLLMRQSSAIQIRMVTPSQMF